VAHSEQWGMLGTSLPKPSQVYPLHDSTPRVKWKWHTVTNTLGYYNIRLILGKKCFIGQAHESNSIFREKGFLLTFGQKSWDWKYWVRISFFSLFFRFIPKLFNCLYSKPFHHSKYNISYCSQGFLNKTFSYSNLPDIYNTVPNCTVPGNRH